MDGVNGVEFAVFIALFGFVSVLGFLAARWRRAETIASLDEWGLGGRNFGPWISWFLIGGDLYTAYTFVAVPALVFGAGAIGFFAVPYTIVVYPLVFLAALRLWSVSHRHGYVTPADFVRGRHGSRSLALAIALTGIGQPFFGGVGIRRRGGRLLLETTCSAPSVGEMMLHRPLSQRTW